MFQTPWKIEKTLSLLKHLSAQFFETNIDRKALITVTDATISPDRKRATIYISVLPEEEEGATIESVRRELRELRKFVDDHARMRVVPFIEVEIDNGEKNRRRIDELLKQAN
jgi:ribosome-binding factor A